MQHSEETMLSQFRDAISSGDDDVLTHMHYVLSNEREMCFGTFAMQELVAFEPDTEFPAHEMAEAAVPQVAESIAEEVRSNKQIYGCLFTDMALKFASDEDFNSIISVEGESYEDDIWDEEEEEYVLQEVESCRIRVGEFSELVNVTYANHINVGEVITAFDAWCNTYAETEDIRLGGYYSHTVLARSAKNILLHQVEQVMRARDMDIPARATA